MGWFSRKSDIELSDDEFDLRSEEITPQGIMGVDRARIAEVSDAMHVSAVQALEAINLEIERLQREREQTITVIDALAASIKILQAPTSVSGGRTHIVRETHSDDYKGKLDIKTEVPRAVHSGIKSSYADDSK